ncbi:YfiR family protein, partial [Burkholderia multivorans]|nr:YfiR family protein [Burkholderia multivorans]
MVATVCAPAADCPTAPAPTSAAATAAWTRFGRCGRAASLRHVLVAVTCALGAVPAALAGFAAYAGAPDEAARIAA